jgi:hypothetical protein
MYFVCFILSLFIFVASARLRDRPHAEHHVDVSKIWAEFDGVTGMQRNITITTPPVAAEVPTPHVDTSKIWEEYDGITGKVRVVSSSNSAASTAVPTSTAATSTTTTIATTKLATTASTTEASATIAAKEPAPSVTVTRNAAPEPGQSRLSIGRPSGVSMVLFGDSTMVHHFPVEHTYDSENMHM